MKAKATTQRERMTRQIRQAAGNAQDTNLSATLFRLADHLDYGDAYRELAADLLEELARNIRAGRVDDRAGA